MRTYIDIVTGFLENGKTTFIKDLVEKKTFLECEQALLIVCEEGLAEYEREELLQSSLSVINLESESELTQEWLQETLHQYEPDYVLFEYNGTWDIDRILGMKLPFDYQIRYVVAIADATTLWSQLTNMPAIVQPHILNSDFLLYNRHEKVTLDGRKELRQIVKNINPNTKVIFADEGKQQGMIEDSFQPFARREKVSVDLKFSIVAILCFLVFLASTVKGIHDYLQPIATVFLSILMQAVPFLLLGAFISAGIQILIPTNWLLRQFEKGKWYSYLLASLGGFFLPICDCGMAPIVSGLLRKGTPLPQTMIFWLASSSVNPVVILSMLYAFPHQYNLVAIRILAGLFIAIAVGLVVRFLRIETKDVLSGSSRYQRIGSDILDLRYKGYVGKIEAVVQGARMEFFRVATYVILGAFLSAVLKNTMSQTVQTFIGSNIIIQFLMMVPAAILMSTCSTSNAFIGKSFYPNISLIPVMTFIVLGPMVDFKNTIMLSAILRKRFLIFLTLLTIGIGLITFLSIEIYLR
ncbi:MAG TPA: permease [Lachnospiraceae bacterium]|nr:permease [Lachnospiraceae bacterium]